MCVCVVGRMSECVRVFFFFYRRDAVLEDRAREAEDGLFGEREGHIGY